MPELPEMEIVARRLDAVLPGETVESALAPGINALKTFDPPLHALHGRELTGVRRRGKLLMLELGELVVLLHLMSAGRLQLHPKRASLRDRTSRLLLRLPGDRELRVREFGTKQAAWVKVLRAEELEADEALQGLGPEAWPDPPPLRELLDAPRPLHSLLRDQQVVTGIGRTWVDEILNVARLSPFKRGDDLSDEEADALRDAMVSELGPRDRRLRGEGRPPAAGEVPEADAGARAPGRAVPAVRHGARGGLLRGLRDELLPARPDRRPRAQGPPAVSAAEVAAGS